MKKRTGSIAWAAVLVAGLAVSSCLQDQHGYPRGVDINRNNDEVVLSGKKAPYSYVIQDSQLNDHAGELNEAKDSMAAQWDWLTVKSSVLSDEIILTARPNTTGKDRKMRLYLYFPGNDYAEITVRQQPTQ